MRRSAAEVLGVLRKSGLRVFRSGDASVLAGLSGSATVKALSRLADQGLLVPIRRGIWALGFAADLHPYELVPHLAAPWPACVSLYSILSDAGVVEEVPHLVYAVTAGRPATHDTPLGRIRFHHLPTRLMWGYAMRTAGRAAYPTADPEKAFLDLAYLALTPRSPLRFPRKRGWTWKLNRVRLGKYAERFDHPGLVRYLREQGLGGALKGAA